MRKLKLQVQISIDGFIAGPNGEMDWLEWNWDDALKQYVTDLTGTIDCIILGRKLAEGFIPYWASVAANADDPQNTAGRIFTDTPKVVFTQTLQESAWANTSIASGNLTDEIIALKNQEGKDIIAYGGAGFVSSLIQHGLVDEFHLFINPTAIGKGLPIFAELSSRQSLALINSTQFNCGIVVQHYQPKQNI